MMNKISSIGVVFCAVLGFSVLTTAAADAQSTGQEGDQYEYCATLVSRSTVEGEDSPVLARACSTVSHEDARTNMLQVVKQERAKAGLSTQDITPLSSDLLMTWFEDADYGGDREDIYGSDGPCDSAGYEFHPSTWFPWQWGNTISSAAGTETCNMADFITQSGTYAQTFNLPVPFLGETLSDNVGIIRTWND
jgi:hypothetical protein